MTRSTVYLVSTPAGYEPAAHFALIDPGPHGVRWLGLSDDHEGFLPLEPADYAGSRGWFSTPGRLTGLAIERPGEREHLGWELIDKRMESDRWPVHLSIAEYDERVGDDGLDVDDPAPEVRFYRRELSEPAEPTVEAWAPERWVELDGAPPDYVPGLSWQAQLPWTLMHSPGVVHLFPGALTGIRAKAKQELEGLAGHGVVEVFTHSGFTVSVRVQIRLERPVWEKRGRDKRAKEYHTKIITRRWEPQLSDRVLFDDYAAARRWWDAKLAELTAGVQALMTTSACSRCNGTGYAPSAETVTS